MYVAADWSEVRIRLPLTRRTRNYVGTIFGGSMYGATDPVYMMMLIKALGSDYIVWDKAATIRFRRPGRKPLYATFRFTPAELDAIRAEVSEAGRAEREFTVELIDAAGEVHATVQKRLSIQRRRAARRSSGGRAPHSP